MGEVYQAHDLKLRRDVALKLLSPALATSEEHLLRFEREARAASALNHPHICTIYDVGQAPEADGRPYLVMELLRGITLYEAMAAGPLSVPTVDRPRRADRRRARRRARRRHHPSRSEAGQRLRDRARRRQAARFRPRRGDRRRRRRIVERQPAGGPLDQPRHRGRHGALHVAGAGARRSARSPHRHLLARPRALRDAHRPPRVRGPIDHRHRRRDPARVAAGPRRRRRVGGAARSSGKLVARMLEKDREKRPATAAEVAARLRAVQSGSMAGREYAATSAGSVVGTRRRWISSRTSTAGRRRLSRRRDRVLRPERGARAGQDPRCHHGRGPADAVRARRLRRVHVVSRRGARRRRRASRCCSPISPTRRARRCSTAR